MPHSIFGWSYPPGCSGPPEDNQGPCVVCGRIAEDCICPECPICGVQGNPECYNEHGLIRSVEQLEGEEKLTRFLEQEQVAENQMIEQLNTDKEFYEKHGYHFTY